MVVLGGGGAISYERGTPTTAESSLRTGSDAMGVAHLEKGWIYSPRAAVQSYFQKKNDLELEPRRRPRSLRPSNGSNVIPRRARPGLVLDSEGANGSFECGYKFRVVSDL